MSDPTFIAVTVLKRDAFSETVSGHMSDRPDQRVAYRRLEGLPLWSQPIAQFLARREARALRAVQGIEGCPVLLRADRRGILRDWSDGTPLHLAKPADPAFYRDARRLLRDMRRRGVTHNDIAKPQNWLMTPDGRAAVIDFQLASVHRRRGPLFRTMAREDLRHLLKQKRAYLPSALTPSEIAMLNRKALPARIWMATAKPLYNFITRRLMNWSDGEGTEDRIDRDGPVIARALDRPEVTGYVTCTFSLPGKGVGLYTFAETDLDEATLRGPLPDGLPDHLHPVAALPRQDGRVDEALLALIAANRIDEVEAHLTAHPDLRPQADPILASRRNLTDRYLRP
ncbi:serine/threonine protein kinase [Pseudooceanicola onchidii]|uniref:serine/threonine protein kinase n=1 Tax=Pseudooceanicola onchidii TaxID=2562279 RepID=UPI0010AA5275|nr:serine/threonine protein kinase [Pseudooceanicola onchidii]